MGLIGNQQNTCLEHVYINQLKDSGINLSSIQNDIKTFRTDTFISSTDYFPVNGSRTTFPLSLQGDIYDNLLVFADGVLQKLNSDYVFKVTPDYYSVSEITITNAGEGYKSIPSITINGSNIIQAEAQAKVVSSSLSNISVSNIGYGYSNTPTVLIVEDEITATTNATATAVLSKSKTMIEFVNPPTTSVIVYHLKFNIENIQDNVNYIVSEDKLANYSATTEKFIDFSVTNIKLQDGIIPHSKLQNFLNESDLTSNSATAIPSQASVKSYADDLWNKAIINNTNIMLNGFSVATQNDLTKFSVNDDATNTINYSIDNGILETFQDTENINTTDSTSYTRSTSSIVKLLLHCNGTPNTKNFVDSSPDNKTMRISGTTSQIFHSSEDPKFGNTSGRFVNYGHITIPDNDDWDIYDDDTENWTIDLYSKFATTPTTDMHIIGQTLHLLSCWSLYWDESESKITFIVNDETSSTYSTLTGASGLCLDEDWHHIAICKVGTTTGLYIDGELQDSFTQSYNFTLHSPLIIAKPGLEYENYFNGWLDEIRITKENIFRANPTLSNNIIVPIYELNLKNEDYIEPTLDSTRESMLLISNKFTTDYIPEYTYATIIREDITDVNDGTDFRLFVSRDDGTNYEEIIVTEIGNYLNFGDIKYYTGYLDLSNQESDSTMLYKINSYNNANFKLHGIGLQW